MSLYLVTGVAGFIGSNIARELVRLGKDVRGLDNFSTGKRENLADLQSRIDFRELDLADMAGMRRACENVKFVLHQAAIPSVPRSVAEPAMTHDSNVNGTLNVLLAARDAGVKRVVFAASSSAYGDTLTLPKNEGMLPNPISPYAVQKLTGELYMAAFSRVYGLETVSLRYFNIFGPHQDPTSQYSGVLAKFISNMLTGKPCTIYGDGDQTRDFTYVENAVDANLLACAAPANKVKGKVFNVATGTRFSLTQSFNMLAEIIGYSGRPEYEPSRAGDVKHSVADISKTREALGYEPKTDFETGLRRTVEWYRKSAGDGIEAKIPDRTC